MMLSLSSSSSSSSSSKTSFIIANRSQRLFATASSSSMVKHRYESQRGLLRHHYHHHKRQRQRFPPKHDQMSIDSTLSSPNHFSSSSQLRNYTAVANKRPVGKIQSVTAMSVPPSPWRPECMLHPSSSLMLQPMPPSSCTRFYSSTKVKHNKPGITTPKHLLNIYFIELSRLKNITNEDAHANGIKFETKCIPNDALGGSKFTSSVYWPLTDEWFHSGIFISPTSHESIEFLGEGTAKSEIVNGQVFYTNAKIAEHAAAARALDCLIYRAKEPQDEASTTIREKYQQLCYEAPLEMTTPATDVSHDTILPPIGGTNKMVERGGKGSGDEVKIREKAMEKRTSPKNVLHNHYRSIQQLKKKEVNFAHDVKFDTRSTLDPETGVDIFTSSVYWPFTDEWFHAGKLMPPNRDSFAFIPLRYDSTYKIVSGRVYYSDGKMAEHAAAARALDCMFFRANESQQEALKSATTKEQPGQMCYEEPYKLTAPTTDEAYVSMPPIDVESKQVESSVDGNRIKLPKKSLSELQRLEKEEADCTNGVKFDDVSHDTILPPIDGTNKKVERGGKGIGSSPKSILHNHYHSIQQLKKKEVNFANDVKFDTKSIFDLKSGAPKFTSSVYWPFTDEWFHAGIFMPPSGDSTIVMLSSSDITTEIFNGCVYYNTITVAKQAAAARALDCLSFRAKSQQEENSASALTKQYQQLCCEEPYELTTQTPDVDYDVLLRSIDSTTKIEVVGSIEKRKNRGGGSVEVLKPTQSLRNQYANIMRSHSKEARFVKDIKYDSQSIPNHETGKLRYTASVYWPCTDEWFHSGIIIPPSSSDDNNDEFFKDFQGNSVALLRIIDTPNVEIKDGRVYYDDAFIARNAAAAHAIDCLLYREHGSEQQSENTENWKPRRQLCYEAPQGLASSTTNVNYDSCVISFDTEDIKKGFGRGGENYDVNVLKDDEFDNKERSIFNDDEEQSKSAITNGAVLATNPFEKNILNEEDIYREDCEGEEEYMIVNLPSAGPISQNGLSLDSSDTDLMFHNHHDELQKQGSTSTMERILEAWADASPIRNSHDEERPYTVSPSTRAELAIRGDKAKEVEAIANALEWYEMMMDHTKFSVVSCNAMLNALADANVDVVMRYLDSKQHEMKKTSRKKNGFNVIDHGDGVGDEENSALVPKTVEELANQILSRMLSNDSNSESNHNKQPQLPNTETYNAYIRCLRRSTSIETAESAESILYDMIQGHGRRQTGFLQGKDLPAPNVWTYNAVMDLWSKVVSDDDDLRERKISELYDQLEAQRMALESISDNKDGSILRPNRATFLIALSSLARSSLERRSVETISEVRKGENVKKSASTFSPDKATMWIERMKRHADEYDDESLRPDTEIYNAPLKWSGGTRRKRRRFGNDDSKVERTSLSYRPWDDYGHIFRNGFRLLLPENVASDESMIEAQQMEDWLHEMEQMADIAPNIETYESIIQAWTRTGTLEGLLKAEYWANRIFDSIGEDANGSKDDFLVPPPQEQMPRLQTFHPIVAAWAHCGHERGPVRVKEWIDRLEELGKKVPGVQPDGRVQAALIFAWRKHQTQIMKEGGISKLSSSLTLGKEEDLDDMITANKNNGILSTAQLSFSAARKCADGLEELCARLQKQMESVNDDNGGSFGIFADGSVFLDVINAWKDSAVAFALAEHKLSSSQKRIVQRQEGGSNHIKSHQALTEILHTVRLFDDIIELYYNLIIVEGTRTESVLRKLHQQVHHFLGISHQVHRSAVAGLRQNDSCFDITKQKNVTDISQMPCESKEEQPTSNFAMFYPSIEKMLRRSLEFQQMMLLNQDGQDKIFADDKKAELQSLLGESVNAKPYNHQAIEYDDLFSYYSNNALSSKSESDEVCKNHGKYSSRYQLFSEILKGSACLVSPGDYGNAVRVAMCILETIAREKSSRSAVGSGNEQRLSELDTSSERQAEDLTDLYVDMVSLVGKVVSNPHERMALLSRILKKNHSCNQSEVQLAIRSAMGDSAMADVLLHDFIRHKKVSKKKRRMANRRRHRRPRQFFK